MVLDLSSLRKSIASLERMIKTESSNQSYGSDVKEAIRAGVIQNFEFTYELCWKFMKRWLENNVGNEYVQGVARRQLFRSAAENLLIDDIDCWMDYHEARNQTAHTYDPIKAQEVFEVAQKFLHDAKKLAQNLELKK